MKEEILENIVDNQKVEPCPANTIPTFQFPFSPETYAPKTENGQRYPTSNKCDHTKHPGMAPRGTRRSMGKR